MFRILIALGLIMSLTGIVAADQQPTQPLGQPGLSTSDDARAILEDHMRSQLDWRSYFTNRRDARARANLAGRSIWEAPRAADSRP